MYPPTPHQSGTLVGPGENQHLGFANHIILYVRRFHVSCKLHLTCLSQKGYGVKFLIRTNIRLISTILLLQLSSLQNCTQTLFWNVSPKYFVYVYVSFLILGNARCDHWFGGWRFSPKSFNCKCLEPKRLRTQVHDPRNYLDSVLIILSDHTTFVGRIPDLRSYDLLLSTGAEHCPGMVN